MTRMLRAEAGKLMLPPNAFAIAGAAALLAVLVLLLRRAHADAAADQLLRAGTRFALAGPIVALAVMAAGELRGDQRRTSLLAVPSRCRGWGARLLVLTGAAACVGALTLAAGACAAGGGWSWPRLVLFAGVGLAAALATDATRSALGGVGLTLGVTWLLPALTAVVPALRRATPAAALETLADGRWPGNPWVALACLTAAVVAGAVRCRMG